MCLLNKDILVQLFTKICYLRESVASDKVFNVKTGVCAFGYRTGAFCFKTAQWVNHKGDFA